MRINLNIKTNVTNTICIYIFCFFLPLSFKKCNKLDEYIYTYFFIISIILLNNFLYNKIVVGVIKKNRLYFFLLYCIIVGVVEINNHG